MASKPHHPIVLSALLRILHSTNKAISWSHDRAGRVKHLKANGKLEEAMKLQKATVMDTVKNGGPVGVMSWTGPGVWTDAVLG